MASINRVILIGNLGRASPINPGLLSKEAREAYEAYRDSLGHYGSLMLARFQAARGPKDVDQAPVTFQDVCRRLGAAIRALREALAPLKTLAKKVWFPTLTRTSAFFHVGKVDGRNLP